MQSGRAHVNSLDSPFFILHSALEWSATRDLHPEGSAILSRRGLLFPLKPVAEKMVGMKGLAPPRLPDSESGPSAIRVEPHAHGTPGRNLTCNLRVRSAAL